MDMRPLGRTGISVPSLCLGSMTWGEQNSEADGHAQMDMALDYGINFIDTAELYSTIPIRAETYGRTEEIIGTWLAKRGRRDDVIIASKIVGPGPNWIDNGDPITPEKIERAIDRSLKRMQTDYIDLYQLHWPNRGSYHFRKMWTFRPSDQAKSPPADDFDAILMALDKAIKAGKIRAIGLSNDSAWGVMKYMEASKRLGLPRMASIQNEYSLLHRIFDTDLAEVAHQEDIGLFAYSVLATGLLTGKYQNGQVPKGSRRSIQPDLSERVSPRVEAPLARYLDIARRHGLDPSQMAIAFCLSRPFMMSVILGATSEAQLKTNLEASTVRLSDEVLAEIDAVYRDHPVPM